MPSPLDLTTLPQVKAWLQIGNANSDGLLGPLITATSRLIYAYLSRPSILPRTFNERYDGQATRDFYLRYWPVLSISSLSNWGTPIPAGIPPGPNQALPNGYIVQPWDGAPPGVPQRVDVYGNYPWGGSWYGGFGFSQGRQNVAVTYQAGYAVQGEAWTVPSVTPWQVEPEAPYGPFASDLGVTYANGTPLALVTGTPAQGQYAQAGGVYTFAVADAGAAVLGSYGFVPSDIFQVCIEIIGERWSYRGRIGEVSKSLGGQETVSFSQKSLPDSLKMILAPYKAVMVPI